MLLLDVLRIISSLEVVIYHWNLHRYHRLDSIVCTCNTQYYALAGWVGGSNITYIIVTSAVIPTLYSIYTHNTLSYRTCMRYWFTVPSILVSMCMNKRAKERRAVSIAHVVLLLLLRCSSVGEDVGLFGFVTMSLIASYTRQLDPPKLPVQYTIASLILFVISIRTQLSPYSLLYTVRTMLVVLACSSTGTLVSERAHRLSLCSLVVYLLDKHPQRVYASESIYAAVGRWVVYVCVSVVYNITYTFYNTIHRSLRGHICYTHSSTGSHK